jgi:hypothetical protein
MKTPLFSVQDTITTLLVKYPHLRDNDEKLMATVWWRYIDNEFATNIDDMTGMDFLKLLSDGTLPSYESISRCRRKVQENDESLRGRLWDKRHKAEKKVIKELNDIN